MHYYTRINRIVSGPISEKELLSLIKSRGISPLDEVSTDGASWRRLGTMPIYGAHVSAEVATRRSASSEGPRAGISHMAHNASGATSAPRASAPPRKNSHRGLVAAIVVLAVVVAALVVRTKLSSASGGAPGLSKYPPELQPVVEYLRPSAAEVDVWFQAVRACSYVQEKWAKMANSVTFSYDPGDDSMNAFAYYGGGDATKPGVLLCGGFVRASRLIGAIALAKAADEGDGHGSDLGTCLRRISETIAKTGGLSEAQVVEFLDEFGIGLEVFHDVATVSNAKGFSEGMCKAALAHELGHLAGGHPRGGVPNMTVSQNEERQADLFASSVAATVANGQQMLVGQIIMWYTLALGEETNPTAEIFRSHPYSAERLRAAVEANKALAASMGIDLKEFDSGGE